MNVQLFAVLYFVALGALLASPPRPPGPPVLPAWSPAWSPGVSSSRPPLLAPWRVRLAARPLVPSGPQTLRETAARLAGAAFG